MSPDTALALRQRCRGGERRLPCDAVQDRPRSAADFDALARHAATLRADVVALQEVDGADAAERVFPRHRFCFTQRHDWQNVGFAIRARVPFRCEADVQSISLARSRAARGGGDAVSRVTERDPPARRAPQVRLQSRATRQPRSQLPTAREPGARGRAVGRGSRRPPDMRSRCWGISTATCEPRWRGIRGSGPSWPRAKSAGRPLRDAGAGTGFRACHAGQPFTRYIDYVLLGGGLAARMQPGSFVRHVYDDREAHHFRLSDHCPVSVSLRLR